ncbi:MAG: ATP-binding protein, partial [Aquimonas sp.]|nr:ATP-binding protein [Aquimonas sp.]
MKKKNQIAEVAVAADASSVLRLMAATFSNANKAVLELVQNGRRAGASRIEIITTENTLTVVDDGSGIDDFGNLLAIAKSGWNEAIQKDESPYGAGFLSALFAAEHLSVSSRGKTMRGKTADIIERLACPIEPDPQAPKKDTSVTLQQTVSALKVSDMEFFLRGFPIPVLINGNEIRRDHADEGNFDDTPIGKIRLALNSQNWVAYLQGMRIASFDTYRDQDRTVVHLDPTRFKGRMPDRDQLIEHEHQVKVIQSEMQALARRQLLQLRENMPADEFAQLTTMFNNWRAWDLLNAVDVLPHSVFSQYEDLPTYGKPWDSGIEEARDVETARGKITTCINRIWCDEN